MNSANHKPVLGLLSVLVVVLGTGCAIAPEKAKHLAPLPPPPSEELRARFGTIGVTTARLFNKAEYQKPVGKGAGAAIGAGQGFAGSVLGGMYAGAQTADPFGFALGTALGIALAPVVAVVGGIKGAVEGVPAEEAKKAEEALNAALAGKMIEENLRDEVVRLAERETGRKLHRLDAAADGTSPKDGAEGLSPLPRRFDTLLEVGSPGLTLAGEGKINPPLTLVLKVRTRLVRAKDGSELYAHTLAYAGGHYRYTEWGEGNAALFRAEIDRAVEALVSKIVEEVFLLYWPAPKVPAPAQKKA